MAGFSFKVEATLGPARVGRITTPHGEVETPAFMPVGTLGAVKAVPHDALEQLGAELLLANTYHLYLRPGAEQVRRLGGLHRFMSWPRALLTDSGGFQVFSLNRLRRVSEEGVRFRSHLDGSSHLFTPERSMELQMALGADLMMAFDECTEYPAERSRARQSMELSLRWAERSKRHFEAQAAGGAQSNSGAEPAAGRALFGIVQGGVYQDLRQESAARTRELDFAGYAIGGLSVGEPRAATDEILAATLPSLPAEKPRYVMGVGTPEEIVRFALMGADLMDCVLPTRAARHGLLYTSVGKITIRNAAYAEDSGPPDPNCKCRVCARYTRAYLRHLYASGDPLALGLNSLHNLAYYLDTMRSVRHSIRLGVAARQLSGSGPSAARNSQEA